MKKLLVGLWLLISLALIGCSSNSDSKIVFNKTIKLSNENFNEHFVLDFETVVEGEKVFIDAIIKPRFELRVVSKVNVEVIFTYSYQASIYNNAHEDSDVSFTFKNNEIQKQTIEIGLRDDYLGLTVEEYDVQACTGKIKTFDIPRYRTEGFVTDEEKNINKFNEMNDVLENLNNYYEANSFSLKVTIGLKSLSDKGDGSLVSVVNKAKLRSNPYYSETESDYGKAIIKQEGEEVYGYTIDYRNHVLISKLSMDDIETDIGSIDDLFKEADMGVNFDFDPIVMKIADYQGGYLITGYYKDFFTTVEYQNYLEQFKALGDDFERMLRTATFSMYINASEEKVLVEAIVDIYVEDDIYIVSSKCTIELTFNDITEIDIFDGNYYLIPADSYNNVIFKSDLSELVTGYAYHHDHIYLTDLEVGKYVINKFDNKNYKINIYDKNHNEINHYIELDNFGLAKYTFDIYEAGEYYVELGLGLLNLDGRYQFQFVKIDGSEEFKLAIPHKINPGLLNFSIDNIYDINTFCYNAYDYTYVSGIIVFECLDGKKAVIYQDMNRKVNRYDIGQNTYVFKLRPQENIFYVYGRINEYSYNVSVYYKDKYTNFTTPYALNPLIWTDNLVLKADLGRSYFSIDIQSEGYISFQTDVEFGNKENIIIYIYPENSFRYTTYGINDEINLVPGKYTLGVSASEPTVTKLRYTFTKAN